MKRWNGTKWIDFLPKRWNGTKWDNGIVKRWNGTKWEIISEETHTTTWKATWSSSYYGSTNSKITSRIAKWGDTVSHYVMWFGVTMNQIISWNGLKSPHIIFQNTKYIVKKERFPNRRNASGWMYQGRAEVPDKFSDDLGRQRSMIGFNDGDMRNKLNGSKIERVELYLRSSHFHFTTGGEAVIGYHNSDADKPSSFSEVVNGIKVEKFTKRNQGMWITLPNSVAEALRDGKARGITLYANTDDLKRYGYFYGVGTESAPQLRITYKK